MPLVSYGATDVGKRRNGNEDAFQLDDRLGLYVVADGVGGQTSGEVASQESVDQICGFVRQQSAVLSALREDSTAKRREAVRRLLESAVQSACYLLFGMGQVKPEQRGMATTISALLLADDYGVIAQVGDSRIYRMRDKKCSQLTEDHTLVNMKLKQGLVTAEEARNMKGKNVITRAVGPRDYVEVDTRELDVAPNDRYILCSDGLHGYLNDSEIESVLAAGSDAEGPRRFVDLANERGGRDNITVALVCVD